MYYSQINFLYNMASAGDILVLKTEQHQLSLLKTDQFLHYYFITLLLHYYYIITSIKLLVQ